MRSPTVIELWHSDQEKRPTKDQDQKLSIDTVP